MIQRLDPPDWGAYDSNMVLNVGDAKYYFENFTSIVDERAKVNKEAITTLDGRVAAIEHQIPVGPGGKGAYLDLGGTPERYPTSEEMNEGGTDTSFMVVARADGIYFYNPVTKRLIKPKKGGGTIAVHGQLPMIYDVSHQLQHPGRAMSSGIYTAKCSDVGLSSWTSHDMCKILVVTTDTEEYHTAMHPDGFANKIFRKGEITASWSIFTGGNGGSGVDPSVIEEINQRLHALENIKHSDSFFDLKDVEADEVTDASGLLYVGSDGKVRGGKTNPLLSMGQTHVHGNSIGSPPVVSANNVGSTVTASSNVITLTPTTNRTLTLSSIVAYNSETTSTTQVREGRITYVVNSSSVANTIRVSPSQVFYIRGSMDSTNMVIPPETVYIYNPAILDNGSGVRVQCWVFMGSMTTKNLLVEDTINGSNVLEKVLVSDSNIQAVSGTTFNVLVKNTVAGSVNPLVWLPDIVDAAATPGTNQVRAGRVTTIIASGDLGTSVRPTGLKFIRLPNGNEVTSFDLKVGYTMTLLPEAGGYWRLLSHQSIIPEVAPVPTFLGLPDTPNTYFPGKLLGYNLSGTALIPVDPINNFKAMTDTPNSYAGKARMAAVVKADESGLEFAALPNLTPLQDDVNNIHNTVVRIENEQTVQDRNITTATTGVTDLTTRVTALENAPAPSPSGGPVDANSVGATIIQNGSKLIPHTETVRSSYILAGIWETGTNYLDLPVIAPKDAHPLPVDTVRVGRITHILNNSSNGKTLTIRVKPSITGGLLKNFVNGNIASYALPPGYGLALIPMSSSPTTWVCLQRYIREQP